ncbi:hypothetical protein HZS_8082 [Henneguya salminicola]|nr:hypothetical protein HZS_8082 [Henneguya salminicola]
MNHNDNKFNESNNNDISVRELRFSQVFTDAMIYHNEISKIIRANPIRGLTYFMACLGIIKNLSDGESQKIEKIIELFSRSYYFANMSTDVSCYKYHSPDEILTLIYALTMLNVDLHNPFVKKRMTKPEFIKNVRGAELCAECPDEILSQFYDDILGNEFKTGKDNVSQLFEVNNLFPIKDLNIVTDCRQFIGMYEAKEIFTDVFKRRAFRPRILLIFNDCIITLKGPIATQTPKPDIYYKLKGLYKFEDYKIYPANEIAKARTNFLVDCTESYKRILQYSKNFSYETEFTHSVMTKIKKSSFDLLVAMMEWPDRYNETCDQIKDSVFGTRAENVIRLRSKSFTDK